MKIRIALIGLLIASLLPACQINDSRAQAGNRTEKNSRSAIIQAAREHQRITVIYSDQDSVYGPRYQEWWEAKAKEIEWMTIEVQAASKVSEETLQQNALFFVGKLTDYPHLKPWLAHLPVQFSATQFRFVEQVFPDSHQVVTISLHPHPTAAPLSIGVLSGNQEANIYQHLIEGRNGGWSKLPWASWNFEVYQGPERLLMGMYTEQWGIDPSQYWNWQNNAAQSLQSTHFNFQIHHQHFRQQDLEQLRDSVEKRFAQIQAFVDAEATLEPIQYHIFEFAEMKGLQFGNMDQSHLDFSKTAVYSIVNADYRNNFIEKENQLLLRNLLGEPAIYAWEEGLSTWFSSRWQGQGWRYWASRLVASGFRYTLEELSNDQSYQRQSELLSSCMAAAMVDFFLTTWGKERFLQQYSAGLSETARTQMERDWQAYLQQLGQETRSPQTYRQDLPPYHKGMTFAHEGYRIYNGYGSKLARESLDSLVNLSVNSLAIVPYSGTREIHKPVEYGISKGAGTENDASVVHAHYAAQRRGMISLLKPQIWFPGSWPGEVEMQNEADWKQFFVYYRRWITHYAMLAEIHQMELFCVGVEFSHATLRHPEAWRQLVQDLRQVYGGAITYAANWGEEIEKLGFGEALDFIGVNCYYPLSDRNQPSDEELTAGANEALDRIEKVANRYNKPVLFTEVGFRSIERPWEHPHDEPRGQDFNEDSQARCYAALLKAVEQRPWIKGLYWWKWPTFMPYTQERRTSFTPCGKAAERVLGDWYQKKY